MAPTPEKLEKGYAGRAAVVVEPGAIPSATVTFHPLVRHEAAQEMRVGPSKSACRSGLQTTLSCDGKEPSW